MKEGWKYIAFEKCLQKVPKQVQVKSKDYLKSGRYPIVSQEADLISGYWNDNSIVYHHEKPIVIFGDHTKNVKYIDFDFVVGADGTHILLPKVDIDTKFFYYAIKSLKLRNLGYARHYKLLKEKQIPVPTMEEQQRIVAYLDSAFAKIDAMKSKAKENLDNAQALFQAALTNAMTPKEGWEEKTLGEITTKIGSGATPKGGKKVYISEGCSLIRSMNVQYNAFKYKELAFIDEDAANQLKGVTIQKNDVLFNITGASIARCCVVPNDVIPARVNQHVAIIRLNKDIVIPNYLSYLLNSPYHQKSLLEIGETGSTRQALTKSDLENHPISFPSKREQENLISMLDKMQDRITALIDNYTTLSASCDTLKQSLLRQVFE
ncbi:MAG: restriction endonuclease subunit S [Bacteroidaceae bacterium]|nr:restriction endonuclease subunit S [Bacteroidaceae bacterium]